MSNAVKIVLDVFLLDNVEHEIFTHLNGLG